MTSFPYILTSQKLIEFMQKIQSMGNPPSVTTKWLPSVGFGSKNNRPIVKVLDFIGFVASNKPTERWQAYKVTRDSGKVLAAGIKEGYSELFGLYPDAHKRSDADLKSFFRAHVTAGDQVTAATVNTFKILCSIADFGEADEEDGVDQIDDAHVEQVSAQSDADPALQLIKPVETDLKPVKVNPILSPEININVQIHISADAKNGQIEKIFESMATHLFNRKGGKRQ